MIPEWILLLVVTIVLIQDVVFLILLEPSPTPDKSLTGLPFVSVLLSIRNEEKNISRSLESLLTLDYPKERFEILVGDDQSTDNSVEIIQRYKKDHDNLKLIKVSEEKKLPAKAGVINELIKQAQGDIFLITDADIKVNPDWIRVMLSNNGAPLVSGCTKIEGLDRLARLQNIEWLSTLAKLKTLSDIGIHPTANGNNLRVDRGPLQKIGGLESLNFNSINEDHELAMAFKQINKPGYFFLHGDGMNTSRPVSSLVELIDQRQRWIHGAIHGPAWQFILLMIKMMMFPTLVTLFIINPVLGIVITLLKLFVQFLLHLKIGKITGEKFIFGDLLIYEMYYFLINFISLVYFLMPIPYHWKGRAYR